MTLHHVREIAMVIGCLSIKALPPVGPGGHVVVNVSTTVTVISSGHRNSRAPSVFDR